MFQIWGNAINTMEEDITVAYDENYFIQTVQYKNKLPFWKSFFLLTCKILSYQPDWVMS